MNIITTIPKRYFAQWKPVAGDPRIARYLEMHDGETVRRFLKCNGYDSDRGELEPRPWYWMFTASAGLPKKVTVGEDVCFMVYDGRVIGYFTIVALATKGEYAWHPEEEEPQADAGDKAVVMATFRTGNYGPMTGFQGWRYTELRP